VKNRPARRIAGLAVAASLMLGGSLVAAPSATAATPAQTWNNCIRPWQTWMNATTGDVSNFAFHAGMVQCAHAVMNTNPSDDVYFQYYNIQHAHIDQMAAYAGKLGVKIWETATKRGLKIYVRGR
jgi:hypothetical protein